MRSLFVDVGSTYVKFSVYQDEADGYIFSDKIAFPAPADEIGFTVERKKIDKIILSIMATAKKQGCDRAYFSVQMHGYLLRDAEGHFSDYYSWRCGGGDTESAELKAIDFSARGTRLKGNLPLAKLYPIKERLSGYEFFTLGSYIVYLLTGNNATHKTDALASGFYMADTLQSDTSTVRGLLLPKVYDEVAECSSYSGIKLYSPVGDHAASFLGSSVGKDSYLLNIGTASQIAYVGSGKAPGELWERRPYFEKGKTLFTLSNILYGVYGDDEKYCTEVVKIIESLPKRSRVVLGGGGAAGIAEKISQKLAKCGMECTLAGCGIGINGLRILSRDKRIRAGIMLSEVAFTNMPLIMKNAGLDFMIVDNEHGAFDYTDIAKMFTVSRLAEFRTVVRLPDNSRAWITKCVDAGADGFLLPMTNTADDIRRVVEYAKYAPVGKRGISTMRAHTLYAPPSLCDYMPLANEQVKVYAQIETAKGVENIEEILATAGVDGVFLGPNDLSCDLSCIGDNAPILKAMEKVAAAAKKTGKPWGIITTAKELIEKAKELSVDMISYGSELNMLKNECERIRKMF